MSKICCKGTETSGVIIWDNSERPDGREGATFLVQHGFKELEFEGMTPAWVTIHSTSVFYRDNNCLDI